MRPEASHASRCRLITAAQQVVHRHTPPERRRRQREQGFTLIEMIIVLAVIGILAAIAIPQFAGILGGAQATVMAGELASASASNVALCRQRGTDHPACVSTAVLATTSVRNLLDPSRVDLDDYKDGGGPASTLSALYAIHIGGAEADDNGVSGGRDGDGVLGESAYVPDWQGPEESDDRYYFVDALAITCDPDVDTQWASMQCAIAEPPGAFGIEGEGYDAFEYDDLTWPWEDGETSPEVVETFQMTYIEAE